MENSLYVALSHQTALVRQLDMVANNMANVNTTGYKQTSPLFTQYLDESMSADRPPVDKISYVQDFGTIRDFSPGALNATGNPLDLAIDGEGFFVIETPDGEQFTRNGHFKIDADGLLVNSDGFPLLSVNRTPFFFAPNEKEINITRDGMVTTENGIIGQIRVVGFSSLQKLRETYNGLYTTTTDNQPFDMTPNIEQGMLEASNVQPVVEMTKMIQLQRAYEAAQRMIEREDARISSAINALSAKSTQ